MSSEFSGMNPMNGATGELPKQKIETDVDLDTKLLQSICDANGGTEPNFQFLGG
jgi:hypothetical protein